MVPASPPDEDHQTRLRIMQLVEAEPGLHKSRICRRLDLPWGTATFHLDKLVETRGLSRVRIGPRSHYALPEAVTEQRLDRALLMPHSREIIALIDGRRLVSPADIAKDLKLGIKTIRAHLNALRNEGIVESDGAYHPRFWLNPDARLGPQA